MTSLPRPYGFVYTITNTVNGRLYIGITIQNPRKRWRHHRHSLRHGEHPNPHLQAAWNKYGEAVFIFEVVQTCDDQDALNRTEIDLIATYGRTLYNLKSGGGFGGRPSEETRRRIAESGRGRTHSEATRIHLRKVLKGIPKTATAKLQAMWERQRGRKQSPETIAKRIAGQVKHNRIVTLRGPDGQEHTTQNLTEFARQHNLHPRILGFVVSGRQRTHHGWSLVEVQAPSKT